MIIVYYILLSGILVYVKLVYLLACERRRISGCRLVCAGSLHGYLFTYYNNIIDILNLKHKTTHTGKTDKKNVNKAEEWHT